MTAPEVLVPADPVKATITWLTNRYPWPVTVVKNRPALTGRVVTVRRTGGLRTYPGVVDSAWLTVECFAADDEDAADLAHHTWGLLFAMAGQIAGGVQCYRVQNLGGPNDFPLAQPGEMQRPRYVMSVQAQFRASAA